VTRLISECAKYDSSFAQFADAGKELDRHYIGSRYPDFYAEGAAHEYYTQEMADKCIRYATSISSAVERSLSK
jgi:HEPN domain-containing protein